MTIPPRTEGASTVTYARPPKKVSRLVRKAKPDGPRHVMELHQATLVALKAGDYRHALPGLCRMQLALTGSHPARAGLCATLAHVYLELDRPERALVTAREALRLDPSLKLAGKLARQAARRL